jgi:hypothetical protein
MEGRLLNAEVAPLSHKRRDRGVPQHVVLRHALLDPRLLRRQLGAGRLERGRQRGRLGRAHAEEEAHGTAVGSERRG